MASDTEIANMALHFIGSTKEISALTTDTSREAKVCRRFFDDTRDEVLRDFGWPFATKFVTLNEIEEEPTSEYQYSYQYPSDCLMFRRIFSGNRRDTRQSMVPYRIGYSETGRIILTDKEDAEGEYTVRVEEVELYPPDFKMAVGLKLAMYIAPALTAGDSNNIIPKVSAWYEMQISKAKANAANEEVQDEKPPSEFVIGREGVGDEDSPWRPIPPRSTSS